MKTNNIESRNVFLKHLSFLVHNLESKDSFKLDSIIKDKTLLDTYKSDVDKLIDSDYFFLAHADKEGYYKKTYRIPEICNRTLSDLKKEKINSDVMEFIENNPLMLHTELTRWLETKHSGMLSYILDKYWHNFMIYTYEYKSWCFDNFGRFIHHVPTPEYEKSGFGATDFIYEHALYFAEYRKLFPITKSILIYNFPYKLLAQNLDFKTIKNIVFDSISMLHIS